MACKVNGGVLWDVVGDYVDCGPVPFKMKVRSSVRLQDLVDCGDFLANAWKTAVAWGRWLTHDEDPRAALREYVIPLRMCLLEKRRNIGNIG